MTLRILQDDSIHSIIRDGCGKCGRKTRSRVSWVPLDPTLGNLYEARHQLGIVPFVLAGFCCELISSPDDIVVTDH